MAREAWAEYGQDFRIEDLSGTLDLAACLHIGSIGQSLCQQTPACAEQFGETFSILHASSTKEHDWYLEGFGPSTKPEPMLLSMISKRLDCKVILKRKCGMCERDWPVTEDMPRLLQVE